jgi:ComF family protein
MQKMSALNDCFDLFFPNYCAGCGCSLRHFQKSLCFICVSKLPRTGMHDFPDNRLERLLWGRVQYASASAFLRMPKQGEVHRMIHELKYKNNQSVGLELGVLFGEELKSSQRMSSFDWIVPVPLHPKRLKERGYNQCDSIVQGVAEATGTGYQLNNLTRAHYNESQTRMSRFKRWQNVESIFQLNQPDLFRNAHVLLMDDVITTGSTIEACALALQQVQGIRISIASIAIPQM